MAYINVFSFVILFIFKKSIVKIVHTFDTFD